MSGQSPNDWKMFGMLSRSHPWHGVPIGRSAPESLNCFIEIVPTDTVKYELEKNSGLLKIDRPQKYSNYCPALYGFVPQTYCGESSGALCAKRLGKEGIQGDGDPLDICVLTEKNIVHGDLIVKAIPIGGFRILDGDEADDKIIAVLEGDLIYGNLRTIEECPDSLLKRLKHYFLTYKDSPESGGHKKLHIKETYGLQEAYEVIRCAQQDYQAKFSDVYQLMNRMFPED